MGPTCTLQLHAGHAWHDVATVTLFGQESDGWRARTYSGYEVAWAVEHAGERDASALASACPVGLEPMELPHWPVFLIDMLPQGFGREELLTRLGLSPLAREEADWRLLMAGAGNPIGNLRVKEAARWLGQQGGPLRGFTDDEVAERGEGFAEYLARHGLFVAGSSGVQGEWAKVLLTRAEDGLLYLDHSLDDDRAREHYIVKFGRGKDEGLAKILRHEGPYMALARGLGLRVGPPLRLRRRALFIRRFDRLRTGAGVTRLGQESIATLCGMPGFGAVPSHDTVCARLLDRSTRPEDDVIEYIKRDVANLALGNKDNHARNTAVQRGFDGEVTLSPLYDFAPMYLHPDGIARRIRWEGNDDGSPDFSRVIDRVLELDARRMAAVAALRRRRTRNAAVPVLHRERLVAELKGMAPGLREIAARGQAMGLEPDVHAHLIPALQAMASHLEGLA